MENYGFYSKKKCVSNSWNTLYISRTGGTLGLKNVIESRHKQPVKLEIEVRGKIIDKCEKRNQLRTAFSTKNEHRKRRSQ